MDMLEVNLCLLKLHGVDCRYRSNVPVPSMDRLELRSQSVFADSCIM